MLTKIERGHEDFDVVCPSEYIIERMLRKGLLLPIDTVFGKTPNYLHNESPYIREQLDKLSWSGHRASDYAIGYMWGTAGILFNTDHVPAEDARTWASLWNLKYENKILMKESYRDAYGTALIYANAEDYAAGHNPSASMIKPVTKTEHRLVFSDLADGQYAVKVFHDENGNHSLDTNMLGVPSEGYGFSNNAGSFGPASFKDASFSLQADAQITIHIR